MSSVDTVSAEPQRYGFSTLMALLAAVVLVCFQRFYTDLALEYLVYYLPVISALALWLFLILFTLNILIVWTWRLWKNSDASAKKNSIDFIVLTSFTLVFLQLSQAVSIGLHATDIYNIYTAYQKEEDAQVTEVSFGNLVITGPLGPNLMRDILKIQSQSKITHITITSNGGLLDQAWQLADLIQKQEISVTVEQYCISACVHVAISSQKSYADENAVFGIHRPSSIVANLSEMAEQSLKDTAQESRLFLQQHGVKDDLLERAANYQADDFLKLTPQEMLASGAISGVLHKGKIVSENSKHGDLLNQP